LINPSARFAYIAIQLLNILNCKNFVLCTDTDNYNFLKSFNLNNNLLVLQSDILMINDNFLETIRSATNGFGVEIIIDFNKTLNFEMKKNII